MVSEDIIFKSLSMFWFQWQPMKISIGHKIMRLIEDYSRIIFYKSFVKIYTMAWQLMSFFDLPEYKSMETSHSN